MQMGINQRGELHHIGCCEEDCPCECETCIEFDRCCCECWECGISNAELDANNNSDCKPV